MDPSLLLAAAAEAAAGQQYPAGALYLVATPIGNLADLSLRALHVLSLADAVACEDTRVSGGLLTHFGLHRPLMAVHEHNERQAADAVLARLAAGQRVAYVSDAGTPAVSDPGARLVDAVVAAGHRVLPVPGPSSVTAALAVAGDVAAQGFACLGFLPTQAAQRAARLAALALPPASTMSTVLLESPHRIDALAQALAQALPARRVTACRELTKQFEEVATLPAADLPGWLAANPQRRRGEYVLVLHAQAATVADGPAPWPAGAVPLLRALLADLPLRRATDLVAEAFGLPRKAVYAQALAWKAEAGDPDDTDA
jgi:16S rRNA (cytidine1402-2'-O)-methyltransferase